MVPLLPAAVAMDGVGCGAAGWSSGDDDDTIAERALGEAKSNGGREEAPSSVAALDGTLLIRDMGGWKRRLPLLMGGAAMGGRKEILPSIDGTAEAPAELPLAVGP